MRYVIYLLSMLLFFHSSVGFATQGKSRGIDRRVWRASQNILNRMDYARPIPSYVIDRAKCVASLRAVKVGFKFGGQASSGMVSCRNNGEWSAPSFFRVSGISYGFQFGVQFMETIAVFITRHGKQILSGASFQLGKDLSFAAGPIGGGGGVGIIPKAHVLTYNRSVGLYAGSTINGFILSHIPRLNESVYQRPITPKEILDTAGSLAPDSVLSFVETLESYF